MHGHIRGNAYQHHQRAPGRAAEEQKQPESGQGEQPAGAGIGAEQDRTQRADAQQNSERWKAARVEQPSGEQFFEQKGSAVGVPLFGNLPPAVSDDLARERHRDHEPRDQEKGGQRNGYQPYEPPGELAAGAGDGQQSR